MHCRRRGFFTARATGPIYTLRVSLYAACACEQNIVRQEYTAVAGAARMTRLTLCARAHACTSTFFVSCLLYELRSSCFVFDMEHNDSRMLLQQLLIVFTQSISIACLGMRGPPPPAERRWCFCTAAVHIIRLLREVHSLQTYTAVCTVNCENPISGEATHKVDARKAYASYEYIVQ